MQPLLSTLVLTLALVPAPQVDESSRAVRAPQGMTQPMVDSILKSKMEDNLAFALYEPKNLNSFTLYNNVRQLAGSQVSFFRLSASGQLEEEQRERFLLMENAVGVQDFPGGVNEGLKRLAEIDTRLGTMEVRTTPGPRTVSQTMHLSRIEGRLASDLIGLSCPNVEVGSTGGNPLIVLSGPEDEVESAAKVLKEADQPLPQIVLQWTLLEAVNDVEPGDAADEAIAKALEPFLRGQTLRRGETFVIRGVAGGGGELHVASSLKGMQGTSPGLPSEVSLTAVTQSFDAVTNRLHLSKCEVVLQRTGKFETAEGTSGSMVNTDQLSTALSLRAGETTVLGSLGGDPVWVALTFTLLP